MTHLAELLASIGNNNIYDTTAHRVPDLIKQTICNPNGMHRTSDPLTIMITAQNKL